MRDSSARPAPYLSRPLVRNSCVRLYPGNAATLFSLVQREGPGRTTIIIN